MRPYQRHIIITGLCLLSLALLATAYRFCTIREWQVEITGITHAAPPHRDSVFDTDHGRFVNRSNRLLFKTPVMRDIVDGTLYKNGIYHITTYGGYLLDLPDIVAVETVRSARPLLTPPPHSIRPLAKASPALPPPRRATEGQGRGYALTTGEAQLARSFFGDGIDTRQVRLHFFAEGRTEIYSTTEIHAGKNGLRAEIAFFGPAFISQDYSRDDLTKLGYFMHEMTHVWQGQTQMMLTKSYNPQNYDYILLEGHPFWRYDNEQQGAMVEDYTRRFLSSAPSPSVYYLNAQNLLGKMGRDTAKTDALLADTVEKQFPQAKKLREKTKR